jgi:hypothetical protein
MKRPLLVACCFAFELAAASLAAQAPAVEKVEPPNWWPGHSINPVRLLISASTRRRVLGATSPVRKCR